MGITFAGSEPVVKKASKSVDLSFKRVKETFDEYRKSKGSTGVTRLYEGGNWVEELDTIKKDLKEGHAVKVYCSDGQYHQIAEADVNLAERLHELHREYMDEADLILEGLTDIDTILHEVEGRVGATS